MTTNVAVAPAGDDTTTDTSPVSLAAQVEHLEERAAETGAELETARAEALETERAFLASRATPTDLANAKSRVAALEAAHGAITARLAPLRAELNAEQAKEHRRAEREAARARLVATAREMVAHHAAMIEHRTAAVAALEAALQPVWRALVAAGESQEAFFAQAEAYVGGTGPADYKAALAEVERAGVDVTALRTELPHFYHPLRVWGASEPLRGPALSHLAQSFDAIAFSLPIGRRDA